MIPRARENSEGLYNLLDGWETLFVAPNGSPFFMWNIPQESGSPNAPSIAPSQALDSTLTQKSVLYEPPLPLTTIHHPFTTINRH